MPPTNFIKYLKIQKELGTSTLFLKTSKTHSINKDNKDTGILKLKSCRDCGNLVKVNPIAPIGNRNSNLMFIALQPCPITSRHFSKDAEDLFTKMLENGMKIKFNSIYLSSLAKCSALGTLNSRSLANCRKFINSEVETINPSFICCLGRECGQFFLNLPKETTLLSMRKKLHHYLGKKVIVTHNPADLLNHTPWKKEAWEDLQMLMIAMGIK